MKSFKQCKLSSNAYDCISILLNSLLWIFRYLEITMVILFWQNSYLCTFKIFTHRKKLVNYINHASYLHLSMLIEFKTLKAFFIKLLFFFKLPCFLTHKLIVSINVLCSILLSFKQVIWISWYFLKYQKYPIIWYISDIFKIVNLLLMINIFRFNAIQIPIYFTHFIKSTVKHYSNIK